MEFLSQGVSFEVFFDSSASKVDSALYKLDQLLKTDNHSDVFSLRHIPLDAADPNPNGRVLEAQRFFINGLRPKALRYRLRNAKRLASRQLRTSVPKSHAEIFVVYVRDETLPGPSGSRPSPEQEIRGSSGTPTDLEKLQKIHVKELKRQVREAQEECTPREEEYFQLPPIEWDSGHWETPVAASRAVIARYDASSEKLEAIEEEYTAVIWRYLCSMVSRKGNGSIASQVMVLEWCVRDAE